MVRSLYTFDDAGQLNDPKIAQLYAAACSVIRQILYMEDVLNVATTYMVQGLLLSGCTLLKLLKTSFAKHVDVPIGQALFLSSVRLMQKVSIANNDFPAKSATCLSLLWRSEKVFKKPDGSEMLELRVRSRSSVSLIYDCLWWCREEFEGQAHAYPSRNTTDSSLASDQFHCKHLEAYLGQIAWIVETTVECRRVPIQQLQLDK